MLIRSQDSEIQVFGSIIQSAICITTVGQHFLSSTVFLSTNIDSLLRIKEVYQCEIILRIMIYIKDEMDHPGITIETSFMELASRLDARIDIDINWY